MKKILLFLSVMFVGILFARADEVNLTLADMGYSNAQVLESLETGTTAISIDLAKGSASTAPTYYDTGGLRVYKNGIITVSAATGYAISEISFTATTASYLVKGSAKDASGNANGTMSTTGTTTTWTGNSDKIIISLDDSSAPKHCRVTNISVTYDYVAPAAIDPVAIACNIEGVKGIVTLTCPTEGVEIYYGFSEVAMNNKYTAPFEVTENCTVYAYAKKGDDESIVKSYIVDLPYTSFKSVLDNSKPTDAISVVGDFEVIYQNTDKRRLILTDGTSNLLIYKDGNNYSIDYPVGTKISKIEGEVTSYNSCFRLIDAVLTEGGNGASYNPIELTSLEELNFNDNLFDEVLIKDCNISGVDQGSPMVELGDQTAVLYDLFGLELDNVSNCDITAFVWRYKDTLEIVPIHIEGGEVTETVETPVITPNKRELELEELVTITCATPDAVIYYTLDGSDPTQESEKYTAPIPFTESCTIKARAYYEKEDKTMFASAIAARDYHVIDPTCNVISVDNHDVDEKNTLLSYVKHTCKVDGVDYSMNAAHTGEGGQGGAANSSYSIMMNDNGKRFCYLIQAGENEGYILDRIEIGYNDPTSKVSFAVRGANSPFDDSAEDWNIYKASITGHGTQIGTITSSNQSISFEKEYKYFALYPIVQGAVYLDNITIRYREPAPLAAPEIVGIEDIDESDILFDEDEATYYVFSKVALDIDFDVDFDSDVAVEYAVLPAESEVSEDTEYTRYTGVSIEVNESAKLVYYAINTKTSEKSDAVTYIFDIDVPAPEAPELEEGDYIIEEGYIKSKDVVKVNFKVVGGVHIYYSVGTGVEPAEAKALRACDKDHAGYTKHEGEEIELNKEHSTFSFYACDPETGMHSEPVTFQLAVATGIEGVEAADNAEVIYLDLQGIQVASPENGVFIRISNGKAEKVVK